MTSNSICVPFHAHLTGETIAEVKETGNGGGPDDPDADGFSLLTIVMVIGGILLAVNIALLYCYVKRRAAKHLFGKTAADSCMHIDYVAVT